MKRFITGILIILLASFMLVGCGRSDVGPNDGSGTSDTRIITDEAPERKIIYTVSTTIYAKNIEKSADSIIALMVDNDFKESETRDLTQIYLKLRIKTSRLDAFIAALKDDYDVSSFRLTSEDVSFNYQDLTNKKVTYEKEYLRLQELIDTASYDQILQINTRIAQLERLIDELNHDLLVYDSLIEFSTVEIYIYQSTNAPTKGFNNKVGRQIETGWNNMVKFVQFLILVFVTLIPWLVLIVPVVGLGFGIYYLNKYLRKRKQEKKDNQKQ
jgi:hypothetical protein